MSQRDDAPSHRTSCSLCLSLDWCSSHLPFIILSWIHISFLHSFIIGSRDSFVAPKAVIIIIIIIATVLDRYFFFQLIQRECGIYFFTPGLHTTYHIHSIHQPHLSQPSNCPLRIISTTTHNIQGRR